MRQAKYPIDKKVLKTLGLKGDPLGAVIRRIDGLSAAELKRQAESLRPFLFVRPAGRTHLKVKVLHKPGKGNC